MADQPWTPEDGPKTPMAVFQNNFKEKESHPDYVGEMLITDTMLRHVINLRNDGKMAVIAYAGWKKKTKDNKPYISGSAAVDAYKTAKRYDTDKEAIQKLMDGQGEGGDAGPEPTPEADADPFADAAEEEADPFL